MSSVFLVEDEALIRMLLAEMIQELGHAIAAEASTIDEGLRLARSADFDLAILDVNLGECTVEPIADVVDRRGLPIIFASGYNETGLPPTFAGRPLVEKPFKLSQLAAAIAAAGGGCSSGRHPPDGRAAREHWRGAGVKAREEEGDGEGDAAVEPVALAVR